MGAMHLSERHSSLPGEVRVEHKTEPCAWLERVRREEEEEGEGASGTCNEGNGREDEQHLRNSLIIAKEYLLICVAVLTLFL